jgi:enolase
VLPKDGRSLTSEEMAAHWAGWAGKFPIVSIEDGMAEDDWRGWACCPEDRRRGVAVGDDLFVTNTSTERGISSGPRTAC